MLSDSKDKKEYAVQKLEKLLVPIDMEQAYYSGPHFKGCWLTTSDLKDFTSFSLRYGEINKWDSKKDKNAKDVTKNYIFATDGNKTFLLNISNLRNLMFSSLPNGSKQKSHLQLCFDKYDFYIPRSIFWKSFIQLHSDKFGDNGFLIGEEIKPIKNLSL